MLENCSTLSGNDLVHGRDHFRSELSNFPLAEIWFHGIQDSIFGDQHGSSSSSSSITHGVSSASSTHMAKDYSLASCATAVSMYSAPQACVTEFGVHVPNANPPWLPT